MENIIDTRIRIPSINYNINLLNFFFETIVCEHYDRVNNLYWYTNHLIINMLVNFFVSNIIYLTL